MTASPKSPAPFKICGTSLNAVGIEREQIATGTAPAGFIRTGQDAGKAKASLQDLDLNGMKPADVSAPPSAGSVPRDAPASENSRFFDSKLEWKRK